MQRCAIAIPIYKPIPDESESASLRQCARILDNVPILLFGPQYMDLSYYRQILTECQRPFHYIQFHSEYFQSVASYNALLLQHKFYHAFANFEFILLYQLDAWVFRNETELWCASGYDYIGAPWMQDFAPAGIPWAVGNGGFSLRRVPSTIHICSKLRSLRNSSTDLPGFFPDNDLLQLCLDVLLCVDPSQKMHWNSLPNEDILWGIIAPLLDNSYRVPSTDIAAGFSFECNPRPLFAARNQRLPFGCHAWQKHDPEFWAPHMILQTTKPLSIVFVTSLIPKACPKQSRATKSWAAFTTRIVSVNSKSEINVLKPLHPDMEFVECQRTATEAYGKPLIYLDDLLHSVTWSENDIICLINADIVLDSMLLQNYEWANSCQLAQKGVVFANRLDLFPDGQAMLPVGFDLFLLHNSVINKIPTSPFAMGAPWWDYYLPILALQGRFQAWHWLSNGIQHDYHEQRYDHSLHLQLAQEMIRIICSDSSLGVIETILAQSESPSYLLGDLLIASIWIATPFAQSFDSQTCLTMARDMATKARYQGAVLLAYKLVEQGQTPILQELGTHLLQAVSEHDNTIYNVGKEISAIISNPGQTLS